MREERKTIQAMVKEFGCSHVLIEFLTLTKMYTRTSHTHSEGMSIVTLLDAMLLLIHTRVFVYYVRNANDADPYACVNVKSQYFINKYWY